MNGVQVAVVVGVIFLVAFVGNTFLDVCAKIREKHKNNEAEVKGDDE